MQLDSTRFTTYVVITTKSPHLPSTVHGLAILLTICSVVTKRKDFITTSETSSHSTRPTLVMTAFPHDSCSECSRRYSGSHHRNSNLFLPTWPGSDSRTRDPSYDISTEPSVVHVCTITSPEIHFTPQSHSSQSYQLPPSATPTPSVHNKRPQLCYSMLSCSAPCRNSLYFFLMSFE